MESLPSKEIGRDRRHFAVGEQQRLGACLFLGRSLAAANRRLANHKSNNQHVMTGSRWIHLNGGGERTLREGGEFDSSIPTYAMYVM